MTDAPKNFNELSPAETERLAMLAEEAGEIVQAVGKILRHGYENCHPDAMSENRTMESMLAQLLQAKYDALEADNARLRDALDLIRETALKDKDRESMPLAATIHSIAFCALKPTQGHAMSDKADYAGLAKELRDVQKRALAAPGISNCDVVVLGKTAAALDASAALGAENARLRERLEISHAYRVVDGEMVKYAIPPDEALTWPDGITCRDATIAGLEDYNKEWQEEVARLRKALLAIRAVGKVGLVDVWGRDAASRLATLYAKRLVKISSIVDVALAETQEAASTPRCVTCGQPAVGDCTHKKPAPPSPPRTRHE